MAEIDLAAKRHVKVGQKGKGGDGALLGQWGDGGEDGTDHAEKQVTAGNMGERVLCIATCYST